MIIEKITEYISIALTYLFMLAWTIVPFVVIAVLGIILIAIVIIIIKKIKKR